MTAHPHKPSAITRRGLLRASAAGAAGALCGVGLQGLLQPARAQPPAAPRKLVVVLNSGGWDTTCALDPKPGGRIDVPPGSLREFSGIPIWSAPVRPAVDAFFERYASRCALINGLQVRSLVHTDCLKRILTGGPSETTPDLLAIAAFERARELPVPYLALGGQARSGPFAAVTGRTGTSNQLSSLVDPAAAYPSATPGAVPLPDTGLVTTQSERSLVRAYLDASAERLRATRGQRGYNQKRVEDFSASLDRAARLRRFATQGSLGERDYTLSLAVQIPLSVRALKDGLSHAVLMQTDNWDTHQDNAQQGALHEALFAALTTLVDALEGELLLDDTLVVVLSEMGRTPLLNKDNGKDHWPVTSALLLGAGVRGGRVLGATSDTLDALPIDLDNGQVDSGGKQLQASNLVAGLLEHLGVDPRPYLPGVEPFRAFMQG